MIIPGWLLVGIYITAFLFITDLQITTPQKVGLVFGSMVIAGMYIVLPLRKNENQDESEGTGNN